MSNITNINIKKAIFRVLFVAVLLFIAVWIFSLVKCEILTHKYYDEFEYAYKENSMLSKEMEYFKVLNVTEETAEVYYVSEGMSMANILSFTYVDGQWKYSEWVQTVWSASGSASDVIWPYWWHFIYSGL